MGVCASSSILYEATSSDGMLTPKCPFPAQPCTVQAENVYLRQLLAAGIPVGAPLSEQAQRYMDVLERNPSWTFAQRKHAAKVG